jgi:hypothetical protein
MQGAGRLTSRGLLRGAQGFYLPEQILIEKSLNGDSNRHGVSSEPVALVGIFIYSYKNTPIYGLRRTFGSNAV